jgi:3-oxoacyl-[acyl-carrier-protein] synthase-1
VAVSISGYSVLSYAGEGWNSIEKFVNDGNPLFCESSKFGKEDIYTGCLGYIANPFGYLDIHLIDKIPHFISKVISQETLWKNYKDEHIDVIFFVVGTSDYNMFSAGDKQYYKIENYKEFIVKNLNACKVKTSPQIEFYLLDNVCASSTVSLGVAKQLIEKGFFENALIISLDLITDISLNGLSQLNALTKISKPEMASIPFCTSRDGFVRSEAIGAIWLNNKNNGNIFITGYGHCNDADHFTAGSSDSKGIIKSIEMCLIDSKLKTSQISVIKAHGTSTVLNDQNESYAFKKLNLKSPVIALKSILGHSAASCGVVELIYCLNLLNDNIVKCGFKKAEADNSIMANTILESIDGIDIEHMLFNTFGFGGNNACLMLQRI